MQKIVPHLWFDKEAREAVEFYVSVFPGSKINTITKLHDTPSTDTYIVSFEVAGTEFQAISAGPYFKLNPSVSFHYKCKTKEEVDATWEKLSDGGTALMELGAYPFSERYGWIQDKFGVSWQVIYTGGAEPKDKIMPAMLFVGDVCGKAEEAIDFWTSVFPGSNVGMISRYGPGEGPDKEGTVRYGEFSLFDQEFGAMDSAHEHQFGFNEAISFIVNCDTQEEIDNYWSKLSAVPESEQCGWLKDKYGFSWQIVPAIMEELLEDSDLERTNRVTQALLAMKKLDLAALLAAYRS